MNILPRRLRQLLHGLSCLLQFDNRIELLTSRIFFRKTSIVVHRIHGMEILVDYSANEQSGTRALIGNRTYECFTKGMSLPTKRLKLIDAGANGGGFPLMLRILGFEIDKLLCVEMNPSTFNRLQFNISRNSFSNYSMKLGGLCGRNAETLVKLGGGSLSDSIYRPSTGKSTIETKVKLYDFDTVFSEFFSSEEIIDIVKVDIEGAEYEMIFDGPCENLTKCRYLIIELHENENYDLDDVTIELEKYGFKRSTSKSSWEDTVYMFKNVKLNARS